jgi:dephospho-CoA kinase
VLSSDAVVHQLYEEEPVRDAVVDRFGAAVAPGGAVDRAELARRAFANPEGRAWLEELIWPLVRARTLAWRESLRALDPRPAAAIVEVPLLFEAGTEGSFDATIAIIADEEVRAQRAGERGHAALQARAARQLSQEEKAQRATYVIVNDGSVPELEGKLSALLEKLHASPEP